MGDLQMAIKDFTESLRRAPNRKPLRVYFECRYFLALARLQAGEIDGYRKYCREVLDRVNNWGNKPDIAYRAAWMCVLVPDAVADLSCVVNLAYKAVEGNSDYRSYLYSNSYLRALGVALYRAGRFEEAVEWLTEADGRVREPVTPWSPRPVYGWFFLAMSHHRLGHRSEAEEWLDKAVRWTADEIPELDQDLRAPVSWETGVMLNLLRDEARALLALPEAIGQPEADGKGVHPEEE